MPIVDVEDCAMCRCSTLHAVVAAALLVTVGALVHNILAGFHAEWDQTTTKPASEKVYMQQVYCMSRLANGGAASQYFKVSALSCRFIT